MALSEEPVNPYDPARLKPKRRDPIKTSTHIHTISVTSRPNKELFFRVHPDPKYVTDVCVLEHEDDGKRVLYLVDSEVAEEFPQEVIDRRLYVCVYQSGTPFLWLAKLPVEGKLSQEYAFSALQIAENAKTYWLRMLTNTSAKHYYEQRAEGATLEPQWPDLPLIKLLELGFPAERFIRSVDHEILLARRGVF